MRQDTKDIFIDCASARCSMNAYTLHSNFKYKNFASAKMGLDARYRNAVAILDEVDVEGITRAASNEIEKTRVYLEDRYYELSGYIQSRFDRG